MLPTDFYRDAFRICDAEARWCSGQAQPGDQGIVRQEDLPRLLRVIRLSDRIRGADKDQDRLTLVTDENGTIVEAYGGGRPPQCDRLLLG